MDIVTLYLVFVIGLGSIHYGILLCIVYVTYSRMIVLNSQYRLNRDTNMSVIFAYIILFIFLLSLPVGSVLGVSQPVGRPPPCHPLITNVQFT